MPRPRLQPGEHGEITTSAVEGGYRARARFCDLSGRVRSIERTRSSKTAAKNAVDQAVKSSTVAAGRTGPVTVRQLVSDYLQHGRENRWRPQTADQYDWCADSVVYPAMGELTAGTATTALFEHHLQAVAAPSTRRAARVLLSGAYAHGIRRGVVSANPVQGTTPVPKSRRKPRALHRDELTAVREGLKAANVPDYLPRFIDVLIGSGARPNEVLALRWPYVDLSAGTITIAATIVRQKVDGRRRLVLQDMPKTDHGRRTITLPDWSVSALAAQGLNPYGLQDGELTTPPGLVFPSSRAGLMDLHNVRRRMREALKDTPAAGFHPYLLRSSALTAVARGGGIEAARDVAGHSSSAITEGHYVERDLRAPDMSRHLDDYRPSS